MTDDDAKLMSEYEDMSRLDLIKTIRWQGDRWNRLCVSLKDSEETIRNLVVKLEEARK